MKLNDIKTIGIVGAGQMGRGISQVCAACGYRVLLVDVSEPAVEEAFKKIRSGVERALERGSLSSHQAGQVLALIHPMVQLDRLLEAHESRLVSGEEAWESPGGLQGRARFHRQPRVDAHDQ